MMVVVATHEQVAEEASAEISLEEVRSVSSSIPGKTFMPARGNPDVS